MTISLENNFHLHRAYDPNIPLQFDLQSNCQRSVHHFKATMVAMAKIFIYALLNIFFYTYTTGKNISCSTKDSLKHIVVNNCSISISDEKVSSKLSDYASKEDLKLLKLHLEFSKDIKNAILAKNKRSVNNSQRIDTYFYTPFEWYITTSRLGQKLINLKPNYETLSLNTLKLKTEVMYIEMADKPTGCLKTVTVRQYFFLVKEFLKHFLKTAKEETSLSNKVCTSLMRDVDGYADFLSICYEKKSNGTCLYLMKDHWSQTLQGFIRFIKFLAILFCPLLIPKALYHMKYLEHAFALSLPRNTTLKVKVSKENKVVKGNGWVVSVPIGQFHKWKYFQPSNLQIDAEYIMKLEDIFLGIEDKKLVSSNYIPTGLGSVILKNIYYCELRESSGFTLCCSSSVCPGRVQSKCCDPSPGISWFHCCQGFMKVLAFLLLPLPWIIRLLIYEFYEKGEFIVRQSAARVLGVRLPFEGYFLGYFSPLHWMFVAVYIIYIVDLFIFGTFVKKMTRQLMIMTKQCVRDMRFGWTFKVFNWIVKLFLAPFTVFGFVGFLLVPFYWIVFLPFIILTLCFYYVPLVNLLVRFLVHIIWFCLPNSLIKKRASTCFKSVSLHMAELKRQINLDTLYPDRKIINRESRSMSCLFRHFQILLVFLCFLTLAAIAILLTECVGYVTEIISFTLIGVILHSDIVLPFFSLGFLVVIYFVRSIKKVKLTYLNCNHMIVEEIIKSVGKYDTHTCAKTAHFSLAGHLEGLIFSKRSGLFCKVSSLLLFLDANELPLIPTTFFYKACEIPINNLPGSLAKNFLKAFANFFLVLIFLIFVTIVVMTFGEIYSISSTNQMLATLAGGFLPWFIEHIIEIESGPKEINTESLNFQKHFQGIVNNFVQKWKVVDMKCNLRPFGERAEEEHVDGEGNVRVCIMESDESDFSAENEKDLQGLYVHFSKPVTAAAEEPNLAESS